MPRYRFEYKYFINIHVATLLRSRIVGIMHPDSHTGGRYVVNNIYLDDQYDSFYYAKHMGQLQRNKYRIRYYNNDLSFIRLERKHKDGLLSYKESVQVSQAQLQMINNGDLSFVYDESEPLWQELGLIHSMRRLRPSASYAYKREAFVYDPGDVRFTFDSPPFNPDDGHIFKNDHLSCSYGQEDYYPLMLEVKYTRFLPEVIQRLLHGLPLAHRGISKYCIVRERGILPYGKI